MIIGTIQAFNEAENLPGAIESLFAAGCSRVVVFDGAWANPDGTPFGGGEWFSTDGTADAARKAGADVVYVNSAKNDGEKRDAILWLAAAQEGDHLLLLDADERIHGRITDAPSGHGTIVLANDKPNDLHDRTRWLDPQHRSSVPLLRWFRWSPGLRCLAPGRYEENGEPIRVYLTEALAARGDKATVLENSALRALRSVEFELPNEHLSVLPIVKGIVISHCIPADETRVAAKEAYYGVETVPA